MTPAPPAMNTDGFVDTKLQLLKKSLGRCDTVMKATDQKGGGSNLNTAKPWAPLGP